MWTSANVCYNKSTTSIHLRSRVQRQVCCLLSMNFLFFDISCVSSDFPEEDSAEDELKAAELHNEEVSDHLSPPI